ncbi:MAG: glycosyltransferase family 9 protein, partial [Ignavibacteria bacterium]|nr:glycosyltransferase family 9 protein [Ignavibacteria bacterium]
VVMITPMIRELKKKYPDAFIATLTQSNTSKILYNNPYVDKIITDDLSKDTFWKVVKEIRSLKFTDGLLVYPTERAAYQMFWGRVRNRIGVGRILYEVITFMKSVSRNNYIPLRHEADYCMDLARKIGVETDNIQPEIYLSEEEKKWTEDYIEKKDMKNKFRIILHTGSRNSSANWSEDKYYRLIKEILDSNRGKDFALMLTALEMTPEFKSRIAELNDSRVLDVTNDLNDLRDLIKTISSIDLMICSSTGPIHISDALDKKSVGIYCHRPANSKRLWGVINKKSTDIEVSKEFCDSHCSADKNTCAFEDGISIEQVLKHIQIK